MHIKRARFVMNIVAIVVTCVILIGATFAWFTDSVTSTSNKIQIDGETWYQVQLMA